jgi:hypothetical protein
MKTFLILFTLLFLVSCASSDKKESSDYPFTDYPGSIR